MLTVYLCGSRSFGAAVFRAILEAGHSVAGVSAPVSGSLGGKDRLQAAADLAGVPVLPAGLLTSSALPKGVDVIVAAHSHEFIGYKTRMRARFGAIGYHPSLLPRHRGRDAVRWAVKMGDAVTGGSVYWLTDNVDAGPIAAQEWAFIDRGETAADLWRRCLFSMGVRLLVRVLADLARGTVVAVPQDERYATWEPGWDRPPVRRPDLLLLGDGSGRHDQRRVADDEEAWLSLGRVG